MKILNQCLFVIFSLILLSSNCKKDNQAPVDELSKLPAATQIGANTFGCLVNGVAFLPSGGIFSGPVLQCNYIFTSGGYYFTLGASNQDDKNLIKQIILKTDSLSISQGQTKILTISKIGNADASYALISNNGNINEYSTNNTISGQLTITYFDHVKQIISGTFYFNATNGKDVLSVTNGRFDKLFTR